MEEAGKYRDTDSELDDINIHPLPKAEKGHGQGFNKSLSLTLEALPTVMKEEHRGDVTEGIKDSGGLLTSLQILHF